MPAEIATEMAEHIADDSFVEREIWAPRRVAAEKPNKVTFKRGIFGI